MRVKQFIRLVGITTLLVALYTTSTEAFAESDVTNTLSPIELQRERIVQSNPKELDLADPENEASDVDSLSAPDIPELVTDRPDFTEAGVVVPKGSLQVEKGFTYENGGDGTRTFNAPELLLRAGLTKRAELRLGLPQFFQLRGSEHASGLGDLYLGSKIQLGPLRGFEVAAIPALNLPVGAERISSDGVDPELKMVWSHDLGEKWSLSGMFAFYWPTEADRHNFTWQPTLSLARSLTERLAMFTEYAGEFPNRGGDVHILHQGFTYAITPQQQLDIHYGAGLSKASPDYFIAAGYTFRLGGR